MEIHGNIVFNVCSWPYDLVGAAVVVSILGIVIYDVSICECFENVLEVFLVMFVFIDEDNGEERKRDYITRLSFSELGRVGMA